MNDETLKVGILGVAHPGHAASYTRALAQTPGVEVAAVYDHEPERGQAFAQRFGVADVYSAPESPLARDDIRAVVVCSATDEHAALAMAAARAGKHVLCEKPIATTLADARAMVDACRAAGVQLHMAMVCRFYPMVQAAKRMIDSGEIGPVYGMLGGNRGRPPLPPGYPAWITDPVRAGGGALIDHSVHVTDAMRHVLGSEVESVYAESGLLFQSELGVDDCGLVLLKFRDGVAASVDPSWSIPASHPYHYDFFLRVLGAEGLISIDDTRQALSVSRDPEPSPPAPGGRAVTLESFGVDVDAAMVRHFVRCVREGEELPPRASGEDGLRALEIALAAYESARRGQPVTLPLEA